MRNIVNLNFKWAFSKEAEAVPASLPEKWYWVNLPHTWNAIDGQDGNNDYFRGTAYYAKKLTREDFPEAEQYYLEFRGANSSADVYVNGKKLAHHDGGYSTWRVNISNVLKDENVIEIDVDNAENDRVYPQMADFTFYGGLYRDVNIIGVNEKHFDLDYYGSPSIKVTPEITGKDAKIEIEVYVRNIETPTLIRYGELTNDEFFVTEKAAKEGITITNTSQTEPIVMLKHFAENPELVIE